MRGIQPENLSPEELVKYAWLELQENGLDKRWAAALIAALEKTLDA